MAVMDRIVGAACLGIFIVLSAGFFVWLIEAGSK